MILTSINYRHSILTKILVYLMFFDGLINLLFGGWEEKTLGIGLIIAAIGLERMHHWAVYGYMALAIFKIITTLFDLQALPYSNYYLFLIFIRIVFPAFLIFYFWTLDKNFR